jgi:hypothetical protein
VPRVELDGALQVRDRRLRIAEARLDARAVVVALPRARASASIAAWTSDAPGRARRSAYEYATKTSSHERRLEDDAGLRADREHGRAVLGGDGAALRARSREDERPGRRVDLVVAEREVARPAQDDVHLLVPVALGVLLDHALSGLLGGVGVRPERGDPKAPPHGTPDELAALTGSASSSSTCATS